MNEPTYEMGLRSASALKLRATRLLAEGGPEAGLEAAILFHDAARAEHRAFQVLEAPSALARLRSLVEVGACYLAGFDPWSAADIWGALLQLKPLVSADVFDAQTADFRARFELESKAVKPLIRGMHPSALTSPSLTARRTLRQTCARARNRFPGASNLWWIEYRCAYEAQDWAKAWTAISAVCRLDPERETPLAMRAELVAHLRTPAALTFADALLARLPDLGPQVALFLSFTLAALDNGDRTRLTQALEAVRAAAESPRRPPTAEESRYIRAHALMLNAWLEGKAMSLEDALYRTGLGRQALVNDVELSDLARSELGQAA